MKLSKLKVWRERRGLSQQALSEKSGVARDGISHYENGTREAHPDTAKRLADALGADVQDLIKGDKVEVEVGIMDEGTYRGETLRFTGELIDSYERGDTRFELYESPNGYRVYVDNGSQESGSYLHPYEMNRYTGEPDYGLYTAEEVAKEWPEFSSIVGVRRVRDID